MEDRKKGRKELGRGMSVSSAVCDYSVAGERL